MILAILEALVDEAPVTRASEDVGCMARSSAVVRWLLHVSCCSNDAELHAKILGVANKVDNFNRDSHTQQRPPPS